MITAIRLKGAGVIEGNISMTIKATNGFDLRWHDQGVEIVRGEVHVLVPWSSIGSVQYIDDPKQQEPTQSQEPTSADPRSDRAAKRARAAVRTSPGR